MDNDKIVALVSSFIGGFVMGFLRGFSWFGEGVTYILALAGGVAITAATNPATGLDWVLNTMTYTLMVFGSIHAQGGLAKARATTNIPAAVMPQFNELSK